MKLETNMATETLFDLVSSVRNTLPMGIDFVKRGKLNLLKSFLGPAYDGLILQKGKNQDRSFMTTEHEVCYDWTYKKGRHPGIERLYEAGKAAQWNVSTDIDWSIQVDPLSTKVPIIPDKFCPAAPLPMWRKLTPAQQAIERQSLVAWLMSQLLHGEQGALYATSQVVQSIPSMDGKLFGASQIGDEARHVEVFHKYLHEKIEKRYQINDNLYVLIEAIMQDSRWDVKFLGMQIMVEGFGLGAFRAVKEIVNEPLLKDILQYVIADEARHVHYGVLALEEFYSNQLSEKEIAEREDLALEICLLLQKRFLAHEIYEEFYGDKMSVKEWDKFAYESQLMQIFRDSMFDLIIPNLKQIGLLTPRVEPMYRAHGLLKRDNARSAKEMTNEDYALNLN